MKKLILTFGLVAFLGGPSLLFGVDGISPNHHLNNGKKRKPVPTAVHRDF